MKKVRHRPRRNVRGTPGGGKMCRQLAEIVRNNEPISRDRDVRLIQSRSIPNNSCCSGTVLNTQIGKRGP